MSTWPRRCGWAVVLTYDTQSAEVLMCGRLNVRRVATAFPSSGDGGFHLPPTFLETDDFIPIHTDVEEQVLP
jgi:hypothetical protein